MESTVAVRGGLVQSISIREEEEEEDGFWFVAVVRVLAGGRKYRGSTGCG